jgi:cytochrome c553
VGDIDSIVGKNPNSIIEELEEMKERSTVEGIMDLHARGYTDTQIRAIAQYLSTLPGD